MQGPAKIRLLAGALALSGAGVASIAKHEGTVLKVYRDPVGILTACTGHTGPELRLGTTYTQQMCNDLLLKDTAIAQKAVQSLVKVPVTQGQYDVLVSFTFNVGRGNLAGSTLLKKLNANDCLGASREFMKWTYARGQQLPGLVSRRADDMANFIVDCHGYTPASKALRITNSAPDMALTLALAQSPEPRGLRLWAKVANPKNWG